MPVYGLSAYNETKRALESYDAETLDMIAMESLQQDIVNIADDLNPKLNDAAAAYSAALSRKDAKAALNAVNAIEQIIKTWKTRLANLPPEAMSKVILRTTCKVAGVAAAAFLMIKGGDMSRKAGEIIAAKTGKKFLGKVGKFVVGDMTVGTGFGKIAKTVAGLFSQIMLARSMSKEDKAKYKDDPKHHNGTYVAAQVGLDQWLAAIPQLKNEIKQVCK